jgi:hypothetical protein
MPKMMTTEVFMIVTSRETTTALAERYGMTYRQVQRLRNSKKYQHLWHLRKEIHNQ